MLEVIDAAIILLLGAILYVIWSIVIPPANFPKNIPTIPFYVSFLGAYTKLDQSEIFETYLRENLEKHGAVKIYFASRWNILVTNPKLLNQVFTQEEVFTKRGNQHKLSHSVLAEYTGDNVISAHGDTWKLYRSVVTQGIQFPDCTNVELNAERVIDYLRKSQGFLPVSDILQRYCLENIGKSMLGVQLNAIEGNDATHEQLKKIKSQIFRPFYMNFPFFEHFPIPSRIKARKAVNEFRKHFCNLVFSSQGSDKINTKTVGYALVQALSEKLISYKQFADNAVIVMVAGHENPQLLLTSLLYVVAKFPEVQTLIRKERVLESPYLDSVIYETLRMYPPLGQIINRYTNRNMILGENIRIPKNTYVGYNNFATGRDRNVWGEDADKFRPERWGLDLKLISKNYSASKSSARLPAFHGRKRACLGERYALLECKVLIKKIVDNFSLDLDPTWKEKLTQAGPVSPAQLRVSFQPLV